MTTFDRIREAAQDLACRCPVVITTRKRQHAREWNAFTLGVDWGTFRATRANGASRKAQVVA